MIPCVLCKDPLPSQFGGAYADGSPAGLLARIYCCPLCIMRLGARSAYARAVSLLDSWRTSR